MADASQAASISIWIPVLSALGGSLITGLFGYFLNKTNKKSEERKHLKTLVFNAATENHKVAFEWLKRMDDKKADPKILPLEGSLLHMVKVADLLFDEKITEANLPDKVKEITEYMKLIEKTYEKFGNRPRSEEK